MERRIENTKYIKLSERTREMLIALAAFNESFWKVSELLTDKSDNETSQEALEGVAYEEQKNGNGISSQGFQRDGEPGEGEDVPDLFRDGVQGDMRIAQ